MRRDLCPVLLLAYHIYATHVHTPHLHQNQEVIGHFRDGWVETRVAPGDSLNIVGAVPEPWAGTGGWGELHLVVDANRGLVILHPDVLISGANGAPRSR